MQELFVDPVVAADGRTYERDLITKWLTKSGSAPMSNETLEHKELTPNLVLVQLMTHLKLNS